MFSLRESSNYKQRQTKTFSIAYRNCAKDFGASLNQHPLMCKYIQLARRTFFAPPIALKGSMTIEGAILLPFFLILMLNLYSIIDMLRLQAEVTWHLHQIGNEMCIYGYLIETYAADGNELTDWVGDVGFSYLYVKSKLEEKIEFPDSVMFTTVSILEEGKVELVLSYNYPLPVPVGRMRDIWLQSKFEGWAWTGRALSSQEDLVYLTETGRVYHLYEDCGYLKLQIQECPASILDKVKEEGEIKWIPCLTCKEDEDDVVYITPKQGKYHFDRECSSLKRTVYTKKIDEIQDRFVLCKRCKERKGQ